MSFMRLIYWTSLIGGWSAFVAWLITELVFGRWIDPSASSALISAILVILMTALVASAIAGGISLVSISNPSFLNIAKRVVPGLVGGLVAGLIGAFFGEILFSCVGTIFFLGLLTRIVGLTLVGVGIGVIEGLLDRSWKKIRNGLIGGLIGGFLGGVFFIPIALVIGSVSGRAFAFVLLGLFIGLFVGLVQVVLKEAWLTVEGGFRPGRQTILSQDVFTMGTSEQSGLIFIAFGAKGVEPTHLRIVKQKDGGYLLEDNASRTGVLLNGTRIQAPTMLRDGDAIQFGVNIVRFNEVVKHGDERRPPPVTQAASQAPKPAIASEAITAKAPAPASAIQATPAPKPAAAIQPAPKPAPPKPAAVQPAAKPAPKPAAPVAPAKPVEGKCPICDKKVVGIPGERRCKECFSTF